MANMEPNCQSLDLRQHPNQNTLKKANVEPESQSMDLHRHPNQTHNQDTYSQSLGLRPYPDTQKDNKQTHTKRKKVPGETSHGLLPTYLVWNEDQGDVVPLKGTELLARNQGKTHYQGAGLEPSVVMHRYPMFRFLPTCTTAS